MAEHNKKPQQDVSAAIRSFLEKPYGIAVVGVAAVAACVCLGLGIAKLLFGGGDTPAPASSQPASAASSVAQSEVHADSAYSYNSEKETIDMDIYGDVVLPETDDAGADYIENTLFIGDSNTVGYRNHDLITVQNSIGIIGMGAGQITSLPSVQFKSNASLITIPKALPSLQPRRVVFGFGTNNLTGDVDQYISSYEKAIKKCYDAYPYFDIIVTAIPPVARTRDYPKVTMQNIDKFNEALLDMCLENEWKFLNTTETLKDSKTGFIKDGYTNTDGLHLSAEGVEAVMDYVRTHAWETKDTRPKPLKSIPTLKKSPDDLIVKDPLKEEAASSSAQKATILFSCTEGGKLEGVLEQQVENGGTCSTVKAVADDGYKFEKWSCTVGSLNASNPTLTFTIPGNATDYTNIQVRAHFVKVEATPTPSTTPEATPDATPEATPGTTPAATPEATPENTPNVTPEVTPAPPTCGDVGHTTDGTCPACGVVKSTPTCPVCGSTDHTSHPTCPVCGSTDHTSHPTCPTCGSTDHTTHPAEPAPPADTGSAGATEPAAEGGDAAPADVPAA